MKDKASLYFKLGLFLLSAYFVYFVSSGMDLLAQYNIWISFLLSLLLSIGSFVSLCLAVIKDKHFYPTYFFVFVSVLQILFTINIYLLPEAGGIPPLIPIHFFID